MIRKLGWMAISVATIMLSAGIALANDTTKVTEATYRKTIASRPAAGYFKIENLADSRVTLMSADSDFAKRVELHTHEMNNGVMSMRKLKSVSMGANGSLEFKPGGHHLMIFGLNVTNLPERGLPVRLNFKKMKSKTIWLKLMPNE